MPDLNNIQYAIIGIVMLVGFINYVEKIWNWIVKKFNIAHLKVNEASELKETLVKNTEDMCAIKEQNRLMTEALRNILRRQLIDDSIKYIQQKELTHEQFEEYDVTYNIYKNMGGNGIGSKYHNEVMKLKVKLNEGDN